MDERLREKLLELGAAEEEIEEAAREGRVTVLVLERLLLPHREVFTASEVVAQAGIPKEISDRLWRAMGFPDTGEDERAYTEFDVAALEQMAALFELPGRDINLGVQLTRVVSLALSRVAEAWWDTVEALSEEFVTEDAGDEDLAGVVLDQLRLEETMHLVEYVLRRQMVSTVRRRLEMGLGEEQTLLTVGFCDLVGWTSMSQQVDPKELSSLVTEFEAICFDRIAELGARLVKTIGDEVMFVADEPATAADVSLSIVTSLREHPRLPDVRGGLACGPVTQLEGDYFGPVVNLASRLVSVARRGTVVVSEEVHQALEDLDRYGWSRLPPRRVKDVGLVRPWAIRVRSDG